MFVEVKGVFLDNWFYFGYLWVWCYVIYIILKMIVNKYLFFFIIVREDLIVKNNFNLFLELVYCFCWKLLLIKYENVYEFLGGFLYVSDINIEIFFYLSKWW